MNWIIKKIDKYLWKKYIKRNILAYYSQKVFPIYEYQYMKDRKDWEQWKESIKRELVRDIAHKLLEDDGIKFEEFETFQQFGIIAKLRLHK